MSIGKTYKRPILAQFHRKNEVLWTRTYNRISTAIPRSVELAILEGQPGDVVEFSNANFGFQIATVKLSVTGKIDIKFSRELVPENQV